MRWASRGQKIPSFRAVLRKVTVPQRLPKVPKSVSDGLLSLFTWTSLKKVRSRKMADLRGFSSAPQPYLLFQIAIGEIAETGGTTSCQATACAITSASMIRVIHGQGVAHPDWTFTLSSRAMAA